MAAYLMYYPSPIGLLEITSTDEAITSVLFVEGKTKPESALSPVCLRNCRAQLEDYFRGTLKTFDLPLRFEGTEFQMQVWTELSKIPYGKVTSYFSLARKVGTPDSVRAVSNTNARNKLCLLLPCHRVIGNDGKLMGYAGGLWRKQWLLDHEQGHCGFRQLKLF
jgi:methylated-DNA-[protein]-cysteine S-methyltransferase